MPQRRAGTLSSAGSRQPTSLNILSWLSEDGKKEERKKKKRAFPGVPQRAQGSCLEKRQNRVCVGFLTAAAAAAGLSHVQRAVCEWEAEWAG